MKNKFDFVKKHKKYFFIGAPILVLLLYFIFGGGENGVESYVVEQATIEQSVMLSGKVTTSDKADLGFAASGRLSHIFVKNNQSVTEGQILAQLEIGDLLADLKIKELNSKTSNVDLENAKEELEKVTAQENTKVENAYRTLLSDDLELIPNSNNYGVTTPIITGAYKGAEGQYKLNIQKGGGSSSDLSVFVYNLERSEIVINEEGSTPLGTRGLYISFPEDVSLYENTIWYLDLPNKASASYTTNLNAYNEALNTRNLAIKNADFEYKKLLTEDDGGSSVAQAEIQKI
ncbi:biotin/lipoyl-binding protein, partial [Candidatus Nomurabacteria bacterium]|nr:biotin/lipoyl-binding protein [Candidatus Nomurabacteria bacterium]